MQIVSNSDNLHEMSSCFLVKNKKNIMNLLSTEFAHLTSSGLLSLLKL